LYTDVQFFLAWKSSRLENLGLSKTLRSSMRCSADDASPLCVTTVTTFTWRHSQSPRTALLRLKRCGCI